MAAKPSRTAGLCKGVLTHFALDGAKLRRDDYELERRFALQEGLLAHSGA